MLSSITAHFHRSLESQRFLSAGRRRGRRCCTWWSQSSGPGSCGCGRSARCSWTGPAAPQSPRHGWWSAAGSSAGESGSLWSWRRWHGASDSNRSHNTKYDCKIHHFIATTPPVAWHRGCHGDGTFILGCHGDGSRVRVDQLSSIIITYPKSEKTRFRLVCVKPPPPKKSLTVTDWTCVSDIKFKLRVQAKVGLSCGYLKRSNSFSVFFTLTHLFLLSNSSAWRSHSSSWNELSCV